MAHPSMRVVLLRQHMCISTRALYFLRAQPATKQKKGEGLYEACVPLAVVPLPLTCALGAAASELPFAAAAAAAPSPPP